MEGAKEARSKELEKARYEKRKAYVGGIGTAGSPQNLEENHKEKTGTANRNQPGRSDRTCKKAGVCFRSHQEILAENVWGSRRKSKGALWKNQNFWIFPQMPTTTESLSHLYLFLNITNKIDLEIAEWYNLNVHISLYFVKFRSELYYQ